MPSFTFTNRSKEKSDAVTSRTDVTVSTDNRACAQSSRYLVLAVKPQILPQVLPEICDVVTPEKLVVSIAAGKPTTYYEQALADGVPVVRVMPNISARVLASASAVCGDVLDIVRHPKAAGGRIVREELAALPSFTRELHLFLRVTAALTDEARDKVLAVYPQARFVQLEGEAFADEFALVTEQGAEDELLKRASELAGVLPCGAPIRYLTL